MDILLLVLLVFFSVLAIFSREMLKAALSLAAASIFLAIIFFRFGAFYAGVFEISVVAGLILVLFVSTIALTKSEERVKEGWMAYFMFPVFFIILLFVDLLIFKKFSGGILSLQSTVPEGSFQEIFWGKRAFDLIGQIGIIFAGVFTVLTLFRKNHE